MRRGGEGIHGPHWSSLCCKGEGAQMFSLISQARSCGHLMCTVCLQDLPLRPMLQPAHRPVMQPLHPSSFSLTTFTGTWPSARGLLTRGSRPVGVYPEPMHGKSINASARALNSGNDWVMCNPTWGSRFGERCTTLSVTAPPGHWMQSGTLSDKGKCNFRISKRSPEWWGPTGVRPGRSGHGPPGVVAMGGRLGSA